MFISDTLTEDEWSSLDKSDHSSRACMVLILNGLFLGLVLVVTSLRMFTKIFMAANLVLDDCEQCFFMCLIPTRHASYLC